METYEMIVEIPKGDNRRRHVKFDKSGFIDLGPIMNVIPVNDGVMPVHYGFIPNTSNTDEGDDVDVLLINSKETAVGEKITIEPIAFISRDGNDHKVVAVLPEDSTQSWDDISNEQQELILKYFGFKHKIEKVENAHEAVRYIEGSKS